MLATNKSMLELLDFVKQNSYSVQVEQQNYSSTIFMTDAYEFKRVITDMGINNTVLYFVQNVSLDIIEKYHNTIQNIIQDSSLHPEDKRIMSNLLSKNAYKYLLFSEKDSDCLFKIVLFTRLNGMMIGTTLQNICMPDESTVDIAYIKNILPDTMWDKFDIVLKEYVERQEEVERQLMEHFSNYAKECISKQYNCLSTIEKRKDFVKNALNSTYAVLANREKDLLAIVETVNSQSKGK